MKSFRNPRGRPVGKASREGSELRRPLLGRGPNPPSSQHVPALIRLRLPVCPHKSLAATRARCTEAAMPGGGCLTARGLRNVAIASAPSVIVILTRFLPVDGLWRAVHATHKARTGRLGRLSMVILALAAVARFAKLAAWLSVVYVPVAYGLDRALAWLRVPKRRLMFLTGHFQSCAFPSAAPGRSRCGSIDYPSTSRSRRGT